MSRRRGRSTKSGDFQYVTVPSSLIAESLLHSTHAKGKYGYGHVDRASGGVTLHHNLWARHDGRNPPFGDNYGKRKPPTFDFRNNVIDNCGSYCNGLVDGRIRVNSISNYLKPGPYTKTKQGITLGPKADAETRFHLSRNHPAMVTQKQPKTPSPVPGLAATPIRTA